eukprot:TRINITY_DN15901_c1_g1_i2.p1 TRINITY_DN15901_c1_g1~~TRINITY_DN15901_c1_g1_i2.p1  ORF type:complete len:725 (+),score=164.47 TRINITY_DN15901_c1_g1_i2:164-2338(+)
MGKDVDDEIENFWTEAYHKAKDCKPIDRLAIREWHLRIFHSLPMVALEQQRLLREKMWEQDQQLRREFVENLRLIYGNEIRGFRQLDLLKQYVLTQGVVRRFCSSRKLHVEIGSLWRGLDPDGTGECTVAQLCPTLSRLLASFKAWAIETVGSCASLWDHPSVASVRKQQRLKQLSVRATKESLSVDPFAKGLVGIGWKTKTEDPMLHAALNYIVNTLDFEGHFAVSRLDLQWIDDWKPPEWFTVAPDEETWVVMKNGLNYFEGNPVRAWLRLDKGNSNQVAYKDFKKTFQEMGFPGDIAGGWKCAHANHDKLTLSIDRFDITAARLLHSFRCLANQSFGSVEAAVKVLMGVDPDSTEAMTSASLTFPEFCKACRRLEWQFPDPRRIFELFEVKKPGSREVPKWKNRTIYLKDMVFLDAWPSAILSDEGHQPEASQQISQGYQEALRFAGQALFAHLAETKAKNDRENQEAPKPKMTAAQDESFLAPTESQLRAAQAWQAAAKTYLQARARMFRQEEAERKAAEEARRDKEEEERRRQEEERKKREEEEKRRRLFEKKKQEMAVAKNEKLKGVSICGWTVDGSGWVLDNASCAKVERGGVDHGSVVTDQGVIMETMKTPAQKLPSPRRPRSAAGARKRNDPGESLSKSSLVVSKSSGNLTTQPQERPDLQGMLGMKWSHSSTEALSKEEHRQSRPQKPSRPALPAVNPWKPAAKIHRPLGTDIT